MQINICIRREKITSKLDFYQILSRLKVRLAKDFVPFPTGTFYVIFWNPTLLTSSVSATVHMAVASWTRLQPFYHHRQTHGELWDSEDWNTFVETKQHMKASCLGPWERCLYSRKFCNQGVRQFVYSVSCQPPQEDEHSADGRYQQKEDQLCDEQSAPAAEAQPLREPQSSPWRLLPSHHLWCLLKWVSEGKEKKKMHPESFHDPSNKDVYLATF